MTIKKLQNAVIKSGIFKSIPSLKQEYCNVTLNSYWIYYSYKNLFLLAFADVDKNPLHSVDFAVIDIAKTIKNGPKDEGMSAKTDRKYISLEHLLEIAPDELKKFIIFNLDLFQDIRLFGEN